MIALLVHFGCSNVQGLLHQVAEDLYLKWRVEGVQVFLKLLNLLLLTDESMLFAIGGFSHTVLVERDRV